MKRNIFVVLLVVVLAFVFSFGFVGCKKQEAPTDQPAVEEKKAPEEGMEKKDEAKEEAKEEEKK